MANKRISELTTITGANLADADLLVVVDVSDTTMASSGTNKKITMAELAKDSALTDNLIAKTTLTTDGDVLTRAAGAPARITRADLAQDSAFSSRYVAKSDDTFWLPSETMTLSTFSGSAVTRNNFGSYYAPYLSVPDGTVGGGLWSAVLPPYWATFHLDLYWANVGAGAGAVYWRWNEAAAVDGESVYNGAAQVANTAVTAAGQDVLKVTRLVTGRAYTAGDLLSGLIWRIGDEATDTLTNAAGIIALRFVRAS